MELGKTKLKNDFLDGTNWQHLLLASLSLLLDQGLQVNALGLERAENGMRPKLSPGLHFVRHPAAEASSSLTTASLASSWPAKYWFWSEFLLPKQTLHLRIDKLLERLLDPTFAPRCTPLPSTPSSSAWPEA